MVPPPKEVLPPPKEVVWRSCATMVAQSCILRNHSCANLNFAQQWCFTYVEPPHVDPPHVEPPYVEPQHVEPPHMWSLHMWSLHMDFLANLIKFARCLANYNNFARSPCKFENFLCRLRHLPIFK